LRPSPDINRQGAAVPVRERQFEVRDFLGIYFPGFEHGVDLASD
jgi:hypothetical protein